MILEDETGRLPTALAPQCYEQFERVLRQPGLLVEGKLEASSEAKHGEKTGAYRSILIEKIWLLDTLMGARPVHGAQGYVGESPRVASAAISS